MTARGMLHASKLEEAIGGGEIDTVLVAFPDLQGRLVGKRVTGSYWVEHMAGGFEPVHACNYLLAVDSEMNVLPGYTFANWAQGYGDMVVQPDLATIRRIPWLDKTALVLCDLHDEHTHAPVEVSPRRILQRQVERAAALGYEVMFASELEFFLFRESLVEAAAKGYANLTPHSDVIEDYHILQTTRDEYVIRAIRNGIDGAGVPVEFSKGEAGRGQHEINLVYASPSRWPTVTSSTRTARRRLHTSTGARSRSWRSIRPTKSVPRATSIRACGRRKQTSRRCGTTTRPTTSPPRSGAGWAVRSRAVANSRGCLHRP